MSKSPSAWSVVGAFLNSPSRKRKEKGKKAEASLRAAAASAAASSIYVTEIPKVTAVPAKSLPPPVDITPSKALSLAEDCSQSESSAPGNAPDESSQEQEWTDVPPLIDAPPSRRDSSTLQDSGSPPAPTADDEIVDVATASLASASPSASPEFVEGPEFHSERHERAVQADQEDDLELRNAEILSLKEAQDELEGQLAGVREDLSGAHRKNQALEETIQVQAGKILSLEALVQALEEEKIEVKKTDETVKQEFERDRERLRELNDEVRRQAEIIRDQTDKIHSLEVAARALEDDKAEANRAEECLREELERMRERVRDLELEGQSRVEAIQQVESGLETAKNDLVSAMGQRQTLEEHNRRLVELADVSETRVKSLEAEISQTITREEALQSRLEDAQRRVQELENLSREQLLQVEAAGQENGAGRALLEKERRRWTVETDALQQKLKVLETDKADLLAGLESSMARNRELEDKVKQHGDETGSREMQLRDVQVNYSTVTTRIQGALEAAIRQNEEIQGQMRRQNEERRVLDQQLHEMRILHAEAIKQPNQRQLERFERQNRMLIDQIRRQSENIRRLRQVPLSPPSSERSLKEDMDVMALVKKLNLEIFQTAAHMADSLNFTGARTLPAHRTRGVVERATLTMGRPMVLALTAISNQADPDFNPLPVQFGIQACLVRCCARIITSWYPGHWEYGEFLAMIYSRIQETGSKIASKWRAVTQAQIKQPLDSELHTSMRGFIQANLVDALIVAGWYDSQSAAQETFTSFRERLAQIVKLTLRLNLAVGEDWESIMIFPNERFESGVMENAYDGEDIEDAQCVVCTTGMGLKSPGGDMVIKPQVVLRSTLREETGYDAFDQ